MDGSPFLLVPEVAALLRVRTSTVYSWTRQVGPDAVPCYRAGKALVFDRDEVLVWFRSVQRHNTPGVVTRPRRIRRMPGRRRSLVNSGEADATELRQVASRLARRSPQRTEQHPGRY